MKLHLIAAALGLAGVLYATDITAPSLTEKETVDVRQKLEAFEKGKITVEDLTDKAEWGRKIIAYYLSHTNDVTAKMKLPISRSLAAFEKYPEAAKLAADYVQVYSNDWRGWNILGGANGFMENFDQAVRAFTNAVRLGCESCYAPLAFYAMHVDRLDIVQDLVPHLLVLKRSKDTREIRPLDIVTALALYSLKANQQDIFVKALDGVGVKDILSRDDLKRLVTDGCKKFKAKEVEKLCQELEKAKQKNPGAEQK
ncbi:MAG: hypothetical protein HY298_00270 [Verrucomicrobia bacterium]|nr:hypothetical protein [Verrucomicrobiota bacterium]